MNRFNAAMGWIAALAATAVAVWFALDLQQKSLQVAQMNTEISSLRTEIAGLREPVEALQNAVAKQAEQTNTKKPDISQTESPSISPMSLLNSPATAALVKKIDTAGLLKGLLKSPGSRAGIAAMFEGPQGEKAMEFSSNMLTNMQYAGYLNSLETTPEKKEQVRAILNKFNAEMMRRGIKAMGGNRDATAMGQEGRQLQNDMMSELQSVIGADGVEQFKDYQSVATQHMVEQSMDMQLGLFAGGLSQEGRAMVRDVLVEELLPTQPDLANPGQTPDSMNNALDQQRMAFDRALQRLQPELSPEDYTAVQGFVRQQNDILEMVSGMFGPKPETNATPGKPAQ